MLIGLNGEVIVCVGAGVSSGTVISGSGYVDVTVGVGKVGIDVGIGIVCAGVVITGTFIVIVFKHVLLTPYMFDDLCFVM